LYYLDHLHTAAAPQNKTSTPRIKFFDKNSIKALTKANKRKVRHVAEPFGHYEVSYSYLHSWLCTFTQLVTHSHFNFIFSSEARPRHAIQLDLRSIANPRQVYDVLYTLFMNIYGTNRIERWT
jgi:hypothetical protein